MNLSCRLARKSHECSLRIRAGVRRHPVIEFSHRGCSGDGEGTSAQFSEQKCLVHSFKSGELPVLLPQKLLTAAPVLNNPLTMRLQPLFVSLVAASFVSAGTSDDQPAPDPNNNAVSKSGHIFSQRIDHNKPSLGTFNQRYFFSDEFWTGQGAPIIIFNVGEQSAENFTTTLQSPSALITGMMKSLGAAGVVIERKCLSYIPLTPRG